MSEDSNWYVCTKCVEETGRRYVYEIPTEMDEPPQCPFRGHDKRYQQPKEEEEE